MALPSTTEPDRPLRDDELVVPFVEVEKPRAAWRIGAEGEKFGVLADSLAPMPYEGERGVARLMMELAARFDWRGEAEREAGPTIALKRGRASITLEPGAQLELSGAPLEDVHLIRAELEAHLAELNSISSELGLVWLGVGFQPFAKQSELSWVPKERYAVMKQYLPTRGEGAHDMMRRTATVQANLDWSSESDALRKLGVCLRLAPLMNALLANSPFYEGKLAGKKSVRGEVWLHMDPERSGLIDALWPKLERGTAGYRDYVEWALDAGMFLFTRHGEVIANTGQSFRSFLANGFRGHRATMADWKLHLNTLFPEARLKNTLEIRPCDSLPPDLFCAVPALCAGLLYDEQALSEAEALANELSLEDVHAARPELVRVGLEAAIGRRSARALAERVIDIAMGGLERRGRLDSQGRDERVHLEPLKRLVEQGLTPADRLTQGLPASGEALRAAILERTRIGLREAL